MYDYDKTGTLDPNGKLRVLDGFDAIAQAIENWMYMALSERIMYPEEGNNLIYFLGKKMNADGIADLQSKISSGIEEDFGKFVTVQQTTVIPVPEEATIHIEVTVTWRQVTKTIETNIAL